MSEKVRKQEVKAVELVEESLKKIKETEDLNAFVYLVDQETLLQKAHQVDDQIAASSSPSPLSLAGIPFALKDNFTSKDQPTTCTSRMLENYTSHYDSDTVIALEKAGAIIMGKTNMDEFAMGSNSRWSTTGPVLNPWRSFSEPNTPLSPGGSSGGSAAAVAARSVFAATGSDTGGSVRHPASFCGVVGLKPTYGTLSRWGLVSFGSSLDCPGIFAKDVKDTTAVYHALLSHSFSTTSSPSPADKRDPSLYHPPQKIENILEDLQQFLAQNDDHLDLKGKKIGIPKDYYVQELEGELLGEWERAAATLQEAGAEVVEVSLPHTKYALPVYYAISSAEAASNLSRYDGIRYGINAKETTQQKDLTFTEAVKMARTLGFGPEVQRRILLGTFCLSQSSYEEYHKQAMQVRTKIKQDFENIFLADNIDFLITPTCQVTQIPQQSNDPLLGTDNNTHKPLTHGDVISEYVNDIMTMPASLAGVPAISVPTTLSKRGLPIGMQMIGGWYKESSLLRAAHTLSVRSGFGNQNPLDKR